MMSKFLPFRMSQIQLTKVAHFQLTKVAHFQLTKVAHFRVALTPAETIHNLLAAELAVRNSCRLRACLKTSRLSTNKTLDDFDFSFQPSLDRHQIASLHELGFLERKENVIFLGPAGVGKTHLAISLSVAAARRGRRIFYGTLANPCRLPGGGGRPRPR